MGDERAVKTIVRSPGLRREAGARRRAPGPL